MTNPNTQWTADNRVPALLDDLRRNPPQVVWSEIPSNSCLFGRDRVWSYAGDAIDALKAIRNEYFLKLDPIEAQQGTEAYMAAARAFMSDQPSVADLIESVEAWRCAA